MQGPISFRSFLVEGTVDAQRSVNACVKVGRSEYTRSVSNSRQPKDGDFRIRQLAEKLEECPPARIRESTHPYVAENILMSLQH